MQPAGFSSLFSYIQKTYHYSGSAAFRRIQAARLSLRYPAVISLLKEGKVNVLGLSFIEPHVNEHNGKELLNAIIGKTKEEIEYLIRALFPEKAHMRVQDKIRRLPVIQKEVEVSEAEGSHPQKDRDSLGNIPVLLGGAHRKESELTYPHSQSKNETSTATVAVTSTKNDQRAATKIIEVRKVKIECVVDEAVANKIQRAKEVLKKKYPSGKLEDIFNEALEALLEKRDPERKLKRRQVKKQQQNVRQAKKGGPVDHDPEKRRTQFLQMPQVQKPLVPSKMESVLHTTLSRYIPMSTKQAVWKRDEGKCTYESPQGRRCEERAYLEVDHIEPFALGGKAELENLRLLCSTHNRYRAQLTFGKQWRRAFE